MASHSSQSPSLCQNKEMDSDSGKAKELNDFMKTATLPMCVCVVSGKLLTPSVQITKGDILFLKSCAATTVTLTHQLQNKNTSNNVDISDGNSAAVAGSSNNRSGNRKQINVPLDFPVKFNVLPPKNVSNKTASIIMYPCISDLLMDSPTYFEATTSYDDPYLPGFSVHRGDRFKFQGLVTDPKDGRERLKVSDELDNMFLLSMNCRANFCPLEDSDSYTLRQLIDFAPVPRRLKIAKRNSSVSFSTSEDSGFRDTGSLGDEEKDLSLIYDKDTLELINFTGVIHMLKPSLLIEASPMNDPDVIWKIPLTADLCVREHDLDDYEVPSLLKSEQFYDEESSISPPQTPTFPAPPAPSLPQPVVPVDIYNFSEIYGCPVKAKIIELSNCDKCLQTLLSDIEDVSILRLEKTKRLYAEDFKTGNIYSLSVDLRMSFIEYPEKFSVFSELISLPIGTEVTILEDIVSDFPQPFCLQFGDLIRITTNTPSVIKPKHTTMECKILKCEKVNREGGSNSKLKIPLDFEVNMVISVDPTERRVLNLDDIITGVEQIPNQEVATLIDGSEKYLDDLPINLKLLKVLPDRVLILSPFSKGPIPSSSSNGTITNGDWPSPTACSPSEKNNFSVSLNSKLVLAFRERLDSFQLSASKAHAKSIQLPFEVLTRSQFEEREQVCKLWVDEDDSDVHSMASDDRSSIADSSSQGTLSSSRQTEKKPKQKKIDKIRRLSQVLNPKHWRPPKAPPEPLPHPEAMGLMALSMRPSLGENNDYEPEKVMSDSCGEMPISSVSSDEEANDYEFMEFGPLRSGSTTPPPVKPEPKGLSGRFHKSLPIKSIISRTYQKSKNKRKAVKSQSKPQVAAPVHQGSLEEDVFENDDDDEDPLYAAVHINPADDLNNQVKDLNTNIPKENVKFQFQISVPGISQHSSTSSLPPLPPRRSASSVESASDVAVSKHKSMDNLIGSNKTMKKCTKSSSSELNQNQIVVEDLLSTSACPELENQPKKKVLSAPPVPSRRKNISIIKPQKEEHTDNISQVHSENLSFCSSHLKSDDTNVKHTCNEKDSETINSTEIPSYNKKDNEILEQSKISLERKLSSSLHQKPPVPKPRGLKKLKNTESASVIETAIAKNEKPGDCLKSEIEKTMCNSKRLNSFPDSEKNISTFAIDRVARESVDDMDNATVETMTPSSSQDSTLRNTAPPVCVGKKNTSTLAVDGVKRVELTKPKLPPKPKPRVASFSQPTNPS